MLLSDSVAKDGSEENPHRYAMRRASSGAIEVFETRFTETLTNGKVVVHGFPADRIPPAVLREFRNRELITKPEYGILLKRFG